MIKIDQIKKKQRSTKRLKMIITTLDHPWEKDGKILFDLPYKNIHLS